MEGGIRASSPATHPPAREPLSSEQHRILAYASAIGPEFSAALLAGAMGRDADSVTRELHKLAERGLLQERSGGTRFQFWEEESRATIYRSLTQSRLRILHRKIAEALEREHPDPSPEVLSELGRHYFLGKIPDRSFELNRRAAERARSADEPDLAIDHLERALLSVVALPGTHRAERAELAEQLGDLYYATARFGAADRYYEEALRLIDRENPRLHGRLLLARAEIAREKLDLASASDRARQALLRFQADGNRVGEAEAYRLMGRLAFHQGAYREALDESLRALDALPAGADERFLGRLSIDIGNAFALLGDEVRPVAIEWYERAVERLRAARDWGELARALHNLGAAVGERRPAEGLEALERARAAAERAHDARMVGRSLLSGVELRLALGDIEEAARDNDEAGRLLERLQDRLGLEQVSLNRGMIAERRGQWEEAEHAYLRAVEMARENRSPGDEATGEFHLARLRFKTRDVEGARKAFQRSTELKVAELAPHLASAYEDLRRSLEGATPPHPPRSGSPP